MNGIHEGKTEMFVWVFHRVTGLLLIGFLGVKFLTSFFLMTKNVKPDWALFLHTNPLIDAVLIVSVVYHALYGFRRGILDPGPGRGKTPFSLFTLLGTAIKARVLLLFFSPAL